MTWAEMGTLQFLLGVVSGVVLCVVSGLGLVVAYRGQLLEGVWKNRDALRECGRWYFFILVKHRHALMGCKPYKEMEAQEKESLFMMLSFLEYVAISCEHEKWIGKCSSRFMAL